MKTNTVSTRRRFFWKAGAALTAPLALGAAHATQTNADGAGRRLALLEDVNAIRALHQAYARHVNAGAHEEVVKLFADPSQAHVEERIRGLSAERFGEQDLIEVAADRRTAAARIHCTVYVETPIGPSCPLVEMARQQGDGVLRTTEKRVLEIHCVKQDGAWKIRRSAYQPA